MSRDTDQNSGVVSGTADLSRDTTVDERGGTVVDAALQRRRIAEERGRKADRLRQQRKARTRH